MILTIIGIVQLAIGMLLLLRGQLRSSFLFLLLSGLFGGSASLLLPALGGSSVLPMQFALVIVFARLLLPGSRQLAAVSEAFRANAVLALFTFYGLAAAFAAPRIFAGTINVTPLRFGQLRSMFDVVPLQPTSQNITTSVYLVTTLLAAMVAHVMCRHRGGAETLVRGAAVFAWIHGITGVVAALGRGTAIDSVFEFFRNASYNQVEQTAGSFVRLNGLYPEPSAYAAVGFTFFVFNCECWYRSILPRSTGRAAALLALILFFSTSSTAYLALSCYAVFFLLRLVLSPQGMNVVRVRQAGYVVLAAALAVSLALIVAPHFAASLGEVIRTMTVDKQNSDSGEQRMFWAMQGWHAFLSSGGLGIGPGSFRSSSLIMAIIGSMGVIGIASFLVYVARVVQPMRASTWNMVDDPASAISAAAGCTVLIMLVPMSIGSPSAAPGIDFGIFAGAALALRPPLRRRATGLANSNGPIMDRATSGKVGTINRPAGAVASR